MEEDSPRLISNVEVMEVIRARSELYSMFSEEDRDKGVDMLFSALEINLLKRKGEGIVPPKFRVGEEERRKLIAEENITFGDVKDFLKVIAKFEASAGVKLLRSEKLQIINLRPDNSNVLKLVSAVLVPNYVCVCVQLHLIHCCRVSVQIIPDRGGRITEEKYGELTALVSTYLLKPEKQQS